MTSRRDRPLSDGVVRLRRPTETDVPDLIEIFSDAEIQRWTRAESPFTEKRARELLGYLIRDWDEETGAAFAIEDASTGELLGTIGMHFLPGGIGEIGYSVRAEARGHGIATRSLRLLVEWGFGSGARARLQLITEPGNVPSQRLAERVGFRREGLLRSYAVLKGERRDFLMYGLLPADPRG